MAHLPFDDESFDAVTVVNGVQHGSDDLLAETARVTRSGARFAMAFWSDPLDFEAPGAYWPPAPSTALKLTDWCAAIRTQRHVQPAAQPSPVEHRCGRLLRR